MNNRLFLRLRMPLARSKRVAGFLLLGASLAWVPCAHGGAPDWLRAAARAPLPKYPDDTDAVVLLDEQVTTVNDKGEIKTVYRRAYKILRPEGRERGLVAVYFDSETRLTYLKAWAIPAAGKDYEVKEKDAIETSLPGAGILYEDTRYKFLKIPAADPGNVIGYEYEQKRRPYVLQDIWSFQDDIPVRRARFELRLPSGWEYESFWVNHAPMNPQSAGPNQSVWELQDLPGIKPEPSMPAWRSLAGRMAVTYFARGAGQGGKSHASWNDVGLWYWRLASSRRQITPGIKQKVMELTANAPTVLEKIQALAAFVQRDVRYLAIEIGIGGYQPHLAEDVFTNRYGDCKDKATLLGALLSAIGVESYYVLINTQRGVVTPNFPTALTFNHAILAIRLLENVPTPTFYSVTEDKKLGRLLFFDPTDPLTPLGYLPPSLQANYGLVVKEDGGELVRLPLLPPSVNRLIRVAKLALASNGTVEADVQEIRWGAPASLIRAQLLSIPDPERKKFVEDFLGKFLGSVVLQNSEVQGLEDYDKGLVLHYRFLAKDYAKVAGNLLLLRPRILGQKSSDLLEEKERKYPVEFPSASLESDIFEIILPGGYAVDELPPPVDVKSPFAEYKSQIEVTGNVLGYKRNFTVKDVRVPTERLDELKKFFRQIAADERSSAVLKQSSR